MVITPLTPSKYHIPASDVGRAITLAKERDLIVFVDDAHMMSRSVFYDEPVSFELGDIDLSVWSLDKHVPGPRGAAIVGRKELMTRVSAQAFQFGLEAQSGHYVAMMRGWRPSTLSLYEKPECWPGSYSSDFGPNMESVYTRLARVWQCPQRTSLKWSLSEPRITKPRCHPPRCRSLLASYF